MNKTGCVWAGINHLVQLEHRVGSWKEEKMRLRKWTGETKSGMAFCHKQVWTSYFGQ